MRSRSFRTFIVAFLLATSASFAGADGKITQIDLSGPDDPNHPNVLQITIEGGFSVAGCDPTYAAIRSDASRQHLIDFAMASYASGRSVKVVLNPSDKYFPAPNAVNGRCAIARISNH